MVQHLFDDFGRRWVTSDTFSLCYFSMSVRIINIFWFKRFLKIFLVKNGIIFPKLCCLEKKGVFFSYQRVPKHTIILMREHPLKIFPYTAHGAR